MEEYLKTIRERIEKEYEPKFEELKTPEDIAAFKRALAVEMNHRIVNEQNEARKQFYPDFIEKQTEMLKTRFGIETTYRRKITFTNNGVYQYEMEYCIAYVDRETIDALLNAEFDPSVGIVVDLAPEFVDWDVDTVDMADLLNDPRCAYLQED